MPVSGRAIRLKLYNCCQDLLIPPGVLQEAVLRTGTALGDRVSGDGNQGVLTDVGLGKPRLDLENGDTRILKNSDIQRKWTLINDSAS